MTINISGIIFHIEEDAYDKLGSYLRTVRSRFSEEDGRDDIMADIESRIAEILNERVGPSKQVVLMTDVDYVISLMGEPEAISDQEEKQESTGNKSAADDSDFETDKTRRRRLYRDTDDKIVGGVCSGLGYYFNVDPIWIRLAFVVVFFLFGTGVLFYILLLIIIPKAETTAEKLEMRREPVDVNNISKKVKEEFGDFKKRAEDFGQEARNYGKKWKDESKYWRKKRSLGNSFEDFFHGVFNLIGRVFAFGLVAIGIFFLIALITSTFSLRDFGNLPFGEHISNLFPDRFHYYLALTSFFVVFGIPIVMIIYKGTRMIFRIKKNDRIIGITALLIWILGITGGIFAGISVGKGFREDISIHEYFPIRNAKMDTIYLNVKPDPDMENRDYHSHSNRKYHYANRFKAISSNGNEVKFGEFGLNIIPSDVDSIQLVVYRMASGSDKREALDRAKAITYTITQKDSLLTFNPYYMLGAGQHWRAQDVRLELLVPKNTVVFLGNYMNGILDDIDNVSNTLDQDMVNRRWIMTGRGLQCIDCAGLDLERKDKYEDEQKPDTIIIKH
ncbi:MAG: PspC domain-containing protein [Bacteroidota bacterium]|nr:PspC domain-containing protein [Bacteroidota bacterium]